MGKKLAEIRAKVENSKIEFYDYLMETEDRGVMESILKLTKSTNVYIFSGVIRNFFLGEKNNRDIDIILEKEIDIVNAFPNAEVRKNSFGGFKVFFHNTTIDLWYLANTWAFKNDPVQILPFDLERKVPGTAFFNFSSIIYSLNDKQFFYEEDFIEFLKSKEIDVVYEKNPNYKLCVVNTFYYADKYDLSIKESLKRYIVNLYNQTDKDYTDVQLKHFGKVIYPNDQIEHRVTTIFYSRKKNRKKKNDS